MARYAMAIDLRTCVGCTACVVACNVENRVDEDAFRCRVTQRAFGRFPNLHLDIFSERCNQCSSASCVNNCPTRQPLFGRRDCSGRPPPVHRMQSLHRIVPVRRALHQSGGRGGEVHLLPA